MRKIDAISRNCLFTGEIIYEGPNGKKIVEVTRAYASIFPVERRTRLEQKLEEHLKAALGSSGTISILAMNVGDKERGELDEEKQDPNTGSLVLKITDSDNGLSIILPGDADGCTWDFMLAAHQRDLSALKTDVLLLSHHGAFARGCSRSDILNTFSPSYCLISTGNVRTYHHPRGEVIKRLEALPLLATWEGETRSRLSCYQRVGPEKDDFRRERVETKKMIFSTLDDGNIEFSLAADLTFHTLRDRNVLEKEPQERDWVFQQASKKEIKKAQKKVRCSPIVFHQCSDRYPLLLRVGSQKPDLKEDKKKIFQVIKKDKTKVTKVWIKVVSAGSSPEKQ